MGLPGYLAPVETDSGKSLKNSAAQARSSQLSVNSMMA